MEQMNSWPLNSVCGGQGGSMTLSFLLVRASELLEPSEKFLRSPSGGIVVVFTFFFVFFPTICIFYKLIENIFAKTNKNEYNQYTYFHFGGKCRIP